MEAEAPDQVRPAPPAEAPARRPNLMRRTYDWVLSWERSRYALPALFVLAFIESSVFPIPPDVLLIALALAAPTRAYRFALVTVVGSVLGGLFGYGIGLWLWGMLDTTFYAYVPGFSEAGYLYVRDLYHEWGFLIVFTAGFSPIPYKLITITAGACSISLPLFMLASVIGRSARFFLVAALIKHFGPPVKALIEKYFNLAALLFVVLLVGGFVAVKYLLR